MSENSHNQRQKTAVVLPGGGARNAYQIGVLRAISDGINDIQQPFDIFCGSSAGALNVAILATHAESLSKGTEVAESLWAGLKMGDVFDTDNFTSMYGLLRATLGGRNAQSVLNNAPLRDLLEQHYDADAIERHIATNTLTGIAVSASSYGHADSVTFFNGAAHIEPWQRSKRRGIRTSIGLDHLIASTAIPTIFKAVEINGDFYGDGSLRQVSPIAAPIHLGADRILVISVGDSEQEDDLKAPSFGALAGHMLDSIFTERVDADLERIAQINHIIADREHRTKFRHIDTLHIKPSRSLFSLAKVGLDAFPKSIRWALRMLGVGRVDGRSVASYLTFDQQLTRPLLALGYADGLRHLPQVRKLIGHSCNQQSSKHHCA
ncbi:MAG: patatin-like phospholipase family protein [Gammaproteobacteria bacterium]|nr:patatin-like phospholipase family protein [Gammaproteobacteria bacterium]